MRMRLNESAIEFFTNLTSLHKLIRIRTAAKLRNRPKSLLMSTASIIDSLFGVASLLSQEKELYKP